MGVTFEELGQANLIVDTVYKGGKVSERKSELLEEKSWTCFVMEIYY